MVTSTPDELPLLRLLHTFKVVLPLELRHEGIVGAELGVAREAHRDWRSGTPLLRSRRCHPCLRRASSKPTATEVSEGALVGVGKEQIAGGHEEDARKKHCSRRKPP